MLLRPEGRSFCLRTSAGFTPHCAEFQLFWTQAFGVRSIARLTGTSTAEMNLGSDPVRLVSVLTRHAEEFPLAVATLSLVLHRETVGLRAVCRFSEMRCLIQIIA